MHSKKKVKQFGDDELLRQRANVLEVLKTSNPEFQGPMQDVLFKRKPGHEQKQVVTQEYIDHLQKQRQRLETEQINLKQAKEKCRMPSPYKVLGPIELYDDISSSETPNSSNVESIVKKNDKKIQDKMENLQKMRPHLFNKKEGQEPSALSHHALNLDNHFTIRQMVTEIMECAMDLANDRIHVTYEDYQDTRLLVDSGEKVLNHQQKFITKEKAMQLITEEFILQVTRQLTVEIVEEWISVEQYARFQAQQIILQTAKHVTTGSPEGRQPQDSVYDLITSTYHRLCSDRQQHRQSIWNHTQILQTEEHSVGKSQSNCSLLSFHPDVERLDFLHVLPNNITPSQKLSPAYRLYRDKEKQYWKNMTITKCGLELSKNVRGISTSSVSLNQRYIAFGSGRGDVIVYDLVHYPPLPVRAFCNKNQIMTGIQHISWSTDSNRLVTVSGTGHLRVWSMQSGPVSQQVLKDLHLKKISAIPPASQLTPLITMHAGNYDFNFKQGPLSETGAQSEIAMPNLTTFHPAHTLLATQNHLMVGLDNGDILRCTLDQSIQTIIQNQATQAVEVDTYPTNKATEEVSFLGNGDIPAQLFRHHKSALMHIGFIGNHGDMVSVDEEGYIFIWKYSKKQQTYLGWFEPKDKYILDMAERVYIPMDIEPPMVYIGDLSETGPYTKMNEASLDYAEDFVQKCRLGHLWHREYDKTYDTVTQIYKPAIVEETGSIFHTLMREKNTGDLLQHYSYYCQPTKNVSTRWLGIQQTCCGHKLIFMMLFPEFWTKGPHITFIIVNLNTFQIINTRIDVKLSQTEYTKCLQNDVCSFQVSQPLDATSSEYIFCYIIGVLRVFSINTGALVKQASVKQADHKASLAMVDSTMVNLAGTHGKIHVISYSKVSNSIEIVKFYDNNCSKDRQSMYKTYKMWKPSDVTQVSLEQTLRKNNWKIDANPNRQVELSVYMLLLQCVDAAIAVVEDEPSMTSVLMEKYQSEARDRMYRCFAQKMVGLFFHSEEKKKEEF